ncbi:MAG: glycosyl hydrolase [Alphaproteobacteria bacterium]|nr:glycosyl hydrolase [Alphaproteobacteria bacterium]MCB9795357.1 glycosyl hydrolase [Alphaproteobacteria bacterium]
MTLLILMLLGCEPGCQKDSCDADSDPVEASDDSAEPEDSGLPDGEEPPREILTVRDCNVRLRLSPQARFSQLQVSGEFNGWSPQDMEGPDTDGYYSAQLGELAPGHYAYKLVLDGQYEGEPPLGVYTKFLDGTENRNLIVGDCTRPLLQTVSATASPEGRLQAEVQVASAWDGAALDPTRVRVTVGDQELTPTIDTDEGTLSIDLSGLSPGKHSVRVWASDVQGRAAENEPLFIPLWVEDEPFTWSDATMYFAFTDRFRNGDWGQDNGFGATWGVASCADFQGGDFLGILHALEEGYFEQLGVNTIWLTPVYENPEGGYIGMDGVNYFTGYHGYWPVDPLAIEARSGDVGASGEDRLRELIEAAHARGIRVLFDLVLNHVHEQHVYVSEHPDWFEGGCTCGSEGCGWDEKAVECWFMPYLPDLNYKNHDITRRVLDDTMRLVELYDVDAVRIDAAKHMDHVIMRSLNKRLADDYVAGGGAPFYLVGETFTSDRGLIMDYVNAHELDGQFDFPLYYAVRSTFVSGGSFRDLDAAVASSEQTYGEGLMSPFLGNHDIERMATAITGQAGDCWSGWTQDAMAEGGESVTQWDVINKMSMGFAFVLTQPGVPLIYYGDEIGLHGGGDPDNRRMMNFDPYLSANQGELLQRVRAIGQARAASEALRRGERRQLWVDDELYVYARDLGGGDVAIVAMNKGGGARSESIDVSALDVEGVRFTDATNGALSASVSGGRLQVSLNSWEYAVFLR